MHPPGDKSLISGDARRAESFALRVLTFGALFLAAYVVVVTLATNGQPGGVRGLTYTNIPDEAPTFGGQTSYMLDELSSAREVDVLWIGSSHAYRTFDPRFFDERGVTTFNMGTTAQTPLNSYFLLREYLGAVDAGVVVLEVYWNVLTWDGVESTFDIIANSDPAPWMLRMALATGDVRAANAFLRRLIDARRPTVNAVQPNLFDGDTYIDRGFVEKEFGFSGNRVWPSGDLVVEPKQLSFLARTVGLVTGRGVPMLLMTQPLPRATLAAITNSDGFRASVQDIADRYDVPFVDFNGRVALDDTADFFDSHHLSQAGLETFLPVLYDTMVGLGFLRLP